jgi:hypothetical protein
LATLVIFLINAKRPNFVAISATACRLLGRCGSDEAPADTIDAALELGVRRRYGNTLHKMGDIGAELHRSGARRRLAFWRAAAQLSGRRALQGRLIEHSWEMEVLGYSPKLQLEDITWLLEDAPRTNRRKRASASDELTLLLWRQADSPADLLSQLNNYRLTPVGS